MPPIYCCLGHPRLRHEAHLATSLKDKGALIGIFWLRAARESRAGIEPGQLGRGDRPGGALADLPRPDGAAADQPEHSHLADGETPRRLFQSQLAAFGLQVAVADGRIRICHGGAEVAVHAEITGRRQRILDPAHFHGVAGIARPVAGTEPATVALPEPALLRPLAEYERVVGGGWS